MIKKNKKHLDNNLNNELFDDFDNMEDISIEEIDQEMNDFHIDKNKFDNITYSFDKDALIKSAIDTAEVDIKKIRFKNTIIKIASVLLVILSIGIYNPSLAHSSPLLMKGLEKVNDFLKIDEITSFLRIDTVFPKAMLDKDSNIKFIQMPKYQVHKNSNDEKIIIDTVHDQGKISDEYQLVSFIHKMSNQIINARDGKKYGLVDITPENIETAMNSIENINDKDARDYLFQELDKWRNGDFSNGVSVHNYVWYMLGGNIGIASSLNSNEINNIVNKYFK